MRNQTQHIKCFNGEVMVKRVVESETMKHEEDSFYLELDLNKLHGFYIQELVKRYTHNLGNVLDIGCGSGELLLNVQKNVYYKHLYGVDASENMVLIAKKNIKAQEKEITILCDKVPGLKFEENYFDTVFSKVTLHHFENPIEFWNEIKRISKNNALIYIMDLVRLNTNKELNEILDFAKNNTHDEKALKLLKQSLLSAFTEEEIKTQLKKVNLNLNIEKIGKKYILISGYNKKN